MNKKDNYTFDEREHLRKLGKSLHNTIKWDDLKPNMVCHMPPIFGSPRYDFKILSKTNFWIRVEKLNQPFYTTLNIYSYDVECNFISKCYDVTNIINSVRKLNKI